MVGGIATAGGLAEGRRVPWRPALFVVAVLGLRWAALGEDPPVAGADAPAASVQQDGDPVATARFGWLLGDADQLAVGGEALACVEAGGACSADGMLAVDTVRAQAASLAAALDAATDPTGDAYLGRPAAATVAQVEATGTAATQLADVLSRWLAAGCGSTVDGVPVEHRAPTCDGLGDEALAAIEAFGERAGAGGA
jgi:hypothetical protein